MTDRHYRVCNLCEAMCGLEIEHEGGRILRVRGDEQDPFSRGAICPKGALVGEVHADPDRLKRPLRKTSSGFVEIEWEEAFDLVERGIKRVREAHGSDSLALYLGNPTVHNLGSMLYASHLRRALHTKNNFSATSMDQLPHHFAAHAMFGHPMLVPVPDVDRTEFMLVLGANPLASNGSLMSAAGIERRLAALGKRGKWVVVDPRRTESARAASEHHMIRPATDVFFLLAFLHVLASEGKARLGRLEGHVTGLEEALRVAADYSPEAVEERTGVPAVTLRRLVGEFLSAERALVYGRMGVCTQAHGGLNLWLINLINILSGNFDRAGGAMFATPAVEVVRGKSGKRRHGRWKSRVRGLPEFDGELPVAVMAEEMLTPGEGQIRALVTLCGNPVLSTPAGARLDTALPGLEFMVSIDIYLNETTRHADVILPPTTGVEIDHYDVAFNALAVSNVAKFSPAIAPRDADRRHDWEILKELTTRISERKLGRFFRWGTPRRLLNLALLTGPYGKLSSVRCLRSGLSLRALQASAHGVDLGPLQSRLPGALKTQDQRVHLAPSVFTEHLQRLQSDFAAGHDALGPQEVLLIGRRNVRDNNSWLHNVSKLMKGRSRCTLQLHAQDAARLKVSDAQIVRVTSSTGSIVLPAEVTEGIMPGVASIPHGYGHTREGARLRVAGEHAGVSVNDITDHALVDPVTHNAAFSGQVVTVEAAE
jgi:anaerobic selenocysteine-containing dehydrogenase